MTAEQKVQEDTEKQLTAFNWLVQNHKIVNIMSGLGVAIREFPEIVERFEALKRPRDA